MLYTEVVKLIEKHRRIKGDPPTSMLTVYEKAEKVKRYMTMYKV